MSPSRLIVFVEEPSAERTLEILLPRLLGKIPFQVVTFNCKHEMLKELPSRLRAYAGWLPADWKILVLIDRDRDDCLDLKARLETMARDAGLTTRSQGAHFQVINRIAVEELEAWFFGDWDAMVKAYPRVSPHVPTQSAYRNPDAIAGGTWERLESILKRAGYFKGGLRKVELAGHVAVHMNPERNTSASFQALVEGVRAALGDASQAV